MPDPVLTPASGDAGGDRPTSGLFGKLPATGDFVARGLPDGFRRAWDGWITRHVAPRLRDGAAWPAGGLRFRLVSGGRVAGGVILPAGDSAGRPFPLSLLLIAGQLPAPPALDPWCDAAAALPVAGGGADMLWQALDDLPPPFGPAGDGPPLLLWSAGRPAIAAPPEAPGAALDALFARPVSSD